MKKFALLGLIFCFSFLVMQVGFAADKEKGLVGYWKFDEKNGTSAKDSSGNGNDGEVAGAEWVKGKIGNCLSFNGENAYVEIPTNEILNPEKITVAAWIQPKNFIGTDRGQVVVCKYGPMAWNGYLLLLEGSSGCPSFHVAGGPDMNDGQIAGDNTRAVAEDSAIEGKWIHVAGTYNGKKACLYVNGVLIATAEGVYSTEDNGPLYIGAQSWANTLGLFSGLIDEVKIYSRVLTADEIKALASAGAAAPEKK